MRKRGIAVILGTLALAALLLVLWLAGLIAHIGGALIHLLLVLALVTVPAGVVIGIIFLVVDGKHDGQR
jgi:hypothetical protein